MVFKTTGGLASSQIPQAQGLVPGTRQGEVTVRGQDDVGNEVRVAIKTLQRGSKVGVVAVQSPDDQGLV